MLGGPTRVIRTVVEGGPTRLKGTHIGGARNAVGIAYRW